MRFGKMKQLFYAVTFLSFFPACSSDQQQEQEVVEGREDQAAEAPDQQQQGSVEEVSSIEAKSAADEIPSLNMGTATMDTAPVGEAGGVLPPAAAPAPAEAPVVAEAVPAAASGDVIRYIVMPGDNLSKIATIVYGPGGASQWKKIQDATPDIKNPDLIFPGDFVNIPVDNNESAKKFSETYGAQAKKVEVTVSQGDTLSHIAAKNLGSSHMWRQLWLENKEKIANPDMITVGMVLTMTVMAR